MNSTSTSIVLLHGALGTGNQLASLESILQTKGCRVFNLTLPGHGDCELQGSFDPHGFAAWLESKLMDAGIAKATFFGYSMGGYVAVLLALRNPGIVGKIVTLGTKWHWSYEIAAQECAMLDPDKMVEKVPKYVDSLRHLHGETGWKDVVVNTSKMMRLLGETNPLNPETLLKTIPPVMVLLGELDQMVSIEESQTAAESIPYGGFEMLKNTPHPISKVDMQGLVKYIME